MNTSSQQRVHVYFGGKQAVGDHQPTLLYGKRSIYGSCGGEREKELSFRRVLSLRDAFHAIALQVDMHRFMLLLCPTLCTSHTQSSDAYREYSHLYICPSPSNIGKRASNMLFKSPFRIRFLITLMFRWKSNFVTQAWPFRRHDFYSSYLRPKLAFAHNSGQWFRQQ